MERREYLFYGFGQVCYSIAMTDGKVQKAEHDDLMKVLKDEFEVLDVDFDVLEISFELMFRDGLEDTEDAYKHGVNNIQTGKKFMNENLLSQFNRILMKIGDAYGGGVDPKEMDIIRRFNKDMEPILTS